MRFIVDECTGPGVANWLKNRKHDVVSIYEESPGLEDDRILQKAVMEERIIITNDKDFGEMVFRENKSHCGIILLRLKDDRTSNKIKTLEVIIDKYSDQLLNNFVVISETTIRIIHFK